MKPSNEITRYRLERWLKKFEGYWEELRGISLVGPRGKGHLQSLATRFPELYSQAVDRYLERTSALEREANVWGQAHFFGLRALGCRTPSSQEAWDLAVNFPLDVDFAFQEELIAYVENLVLPATTADDLLLASECALSLLKLWDIGMSPWLLSRVAPQCGMDLFSAHTQFQYPDDKIRRRVMRLGVGYCLEIFEIAAEACESWREMHIDEGQATASRDAELRVCNARMEQFEGILFILESQQMLNESLSDTMDPTGWMERFKEVGPAEISLEKLEVISGEDVERLAPVLDAFLMQETERCSRDVSGIAEAIRAGKEVPSTEILVFLLRNMENDPSLNEEVFEDWIPRLSDADKRSVVEWAARRTLDRYITEMEPILGERISSDGFDISDLETVEERSAEISATSVRYDVLVERLQQEKAAEVTHLSEIRKSDPNTERIPVVSPLDEL